MSSPSTQRRALRGVDRNDFEQVVGQRDEARADAERLRVVLRQLKSYAYKHDDRKMLKLVAEALREDVSS